MKLTLGHSPDPDDAFMFYALAKHLLPTPGYEFEHILQDIQTLNERATRAELDITAISIHAYAYVLKDYALLRSGASMGDNYGPMIVGKRAFTQRAVALLTHRRPGPDDQRVSWRCNFSSACRKDKLNSWWCRSMRFSHAIERGDADAGLIIHEGQLTYETEGLVLSADLGQWWFAETGGLPLPLGRQCGEEVAGPKGDLGAFHDSLRQHQVWARSSRGRRGACAAVGARAG